MSSVQPFQFEPERNINEEDNTENVSQNGHRNEDEERRDEARVGQTGVVYAAASPCQPRRVFVVKELQFLSAAVQGKLCDKTYSNINNFGDY